MTINKIILVMTLIAASTISFVSMEGAAQSHSDLTMELNNTLHKYANKILNEKDKDGGFITAISLTAQCGNKVPVSIAKGVNGIKDLTPINENSIFQIGSITKSFISIVILQIVQENKISIDDNTIMMKWFPEYPKWGHVTLRQLMNMTSGIPGNENNLPDDIFKKFTAKEYTGKIDPVKILNLTYQLPLHFRPGTQFEYSNTNYILLGRFIKKITHNDPEIEVTKRIINKLNLKNTYFPIDKENEIPKIDKRKVHGYAFFPKTSHPYQFIAYGADTLTYSLSYTNTAGAMISTPNDINVYLHAIFYKTGLFNKYQKQLTDFVSRKTGKQIVLPTVADRQGFGFGIAGYYWNENKPIIYLYNGVTDGFNFGWLIDPKSQIYLIFALNSRADILTLESALELFTKIENSCSLIEEK